MAIIEKPLALTSGEQHAERPLGVLTRPKANGSWKDWVSTVDHKKIGIMYGVAAMFFFLVGGLEALLIRRALSATGGNRSQAARLLDISYKALVYKIRGYGLEEP